ncbi:MAG TPA: carboxymuconolactone decarboxylase family protein, partial [Candidatus Saccharimonadia bacterium]|nr:carboxymuconolactone decarboxylase family protein [Candidatus Saccharimonadia bacterium]
AKINPQLREQIALALSQRNACGYCLAAHTTLSQGAGITSDVIAAARSARSGDPREQAALHFAMALVEKRGHVSTDEMNQLRAAGFDAAEVLEIIMTVIFNLFTNYVNSAVDTDVDFPVVPLDVMA